MQAMTALKTAGRATGRSLSVFAGDVGRGMLELAHNSLALLGLAVLAVALFVAGRPELRQKAETLAFDWLQARHEARAEARGDVLTLVGEADAVQRATAIDPAELSKQQAAVASWIARRYRVAPEPISRLVKEAWDVGRRARLDPTLILAVMAIESSFNPFAQSSVGAQGLMQVLTRVHDEKYQAFGGVHAAFDPLTNLRVGVQVLRDCIDRAGSVEAGLRYYVGAALLDDDGGYAAKVLFEQSHLRRVAEGQRIAVTAPATPPPAALAVDGAPAPRAPASAPETDVEGRQVALARP